MAEDVNRYDRAALGAGVLGWVYEFTNTTPVHTSDAMATGLELGVQLVGDWFHRGARTGAKLYGPGSVHVISPAERYSLTCPARRDVAGLQVGFIVYPNEIAELAASGDADVVFAPGVDLDRPFLEFCRAYQIANDRGARLPEAQARDEVLRFVRRHLELMPSDPLSRAKTLIDETFTQALYLEHVAEVAGMHPRTFARKFAAKYGLTPISYRLRLRLNEAARLTWAAPTLTIRAVAERVGFEDLAYFHRTFMAMFQTTPAAYGRRSASAAATSNEQSRCWGPTA